MSISKITMLGLETWQNNKDKSLFDNLVLPSNFDKSVVTDNILLRAGEMEVLYPDPDFLTGAIGLWGRKHYKTFDKWLKALNVEYNPLENYDRFEEYTDLHTGTDTTDIGKVEASDTHGKQHSENVMGEQVTTNDMAAITNTDVMDSQHTVNENTVSAFDSSTYSPSEKNENTLDAHTDTHTQGAHVDTNTIGEHTNTVDVDSFTDRHSEDARTDVITHDTEVKHTSRIHGNIGVTTSQQMLSSELEIATWNLYEHIADLFITEFCIMVY